MLSDEGALKFKKLLNEYRESLGPKRLGLDDCWQDVQKYTWSVKSLNRLQIYVHRLAGSAAPYGFDAISEASSKLEKLILDYLDGDGALGTRQDAARECIETGLQQLCKALDEGKSTPD